MTLTKDTKKLCKKCFGQKPAREIRSLQDEPRFANEDGAYTEYGFISGFANDTDEQIDEWLDENIRIRYIDRGFDCTGQAFTYWIHWKRTPDRDVISFTHYVVYDY